MNDTSRPMTGGDTWGHSGLDLPDLLWQEVERRALEDAAPREQAAQTVTEAPEAVPPAPPQAARYLYD
jgi:hypothetical protein